MNYKSISAGDQVKWLDPAFIDLHQRDRSDAANRKEITEYLNRVYIVGNTPDEEDDIISLDSDAEVFASELYPATASISLDSHYKPVITY